MSLYWDHNIPQSSIFSAGTSMILGFRTEPSFCIFVAASSPSNPDVHVGDVVLRLDSLRAPASLHGEQTEQQQVFERCAVRFGSILHAAYFIHSFSATLASLSAPVTMVVQRGQTPPREIRIKPDSNPHPDHVLDFFERLQKDINDDDSEHAPANETSPSHNSHTDPCVLLALRSSLI